MGIILILVVGAILGWLCAIVLGRDDSRGVALCLLAGAAGAVLAAADAGPVPLAAGVGPLQLVWGALGALLAIVVANLVGDRVIPRERAMP